ncbi:hypothetical protein LTR28_008730 [Elasticomyces elasticus]|nr:hypothetical protein LTR28_008730 [Elasticomyces elasticus]
MAALYFTSFFPSHPFWVAFCPSGPQSERWWQECWRLSIEEDPAARNFVVIDKDARSEDGDGKGKAVAFSRWIEPQRDGSLEKVWPALPDHFDMELCGQFFGGMDENRKELMGSRPHWCMQIYQFFSLPMASRGSVLIPSRSPRTPWHRRALSTPRDRP